MTFGQFKPQPSRAQRLKARSRRNATMASTVHGRAAVMIGSTSGVAVVKRPYVRSKVLLAAVRLLPCQESGRVGETEPAHSNWPQHGKAGAIKADDNRIAALHRDIHRDLDQGSHWSAEERQALWWRAHQATVRELLARGLWPAGVPVPQIEDFWRA